jgi:SSS family solute:Na+ symporter
MFWKRTTGHGAFWGYLSGLAAAGLTLGLTVAEGKGGWITPLHQFPSSMAQNFWIALIAWSMCFVVTILISLATKPKPASQLKNLVYGHTEMPPAANVPWYQRPAPLAIIVLAVLVVMNVIFW